MYTSLTVIDTVATLELRVVSASFAVYVKLSEPANPRFGVYTNEPLALNATVPFAGPLATFAVTTGLSSSVSLPRTPGAVTTSAVP